MDVHTDGVAAVTVTGVEANVHAETGVAAVTLIDVDEEAVTTGETGVAVEAIGEVVTGSAAAGCCGTVLLMTRHSDLSCNKKGYLICFILS